MARQRPAKPCTRVRFPSPPLFFLKPARLAQRESASLTRKRSLVRSQYRAPLNVTVERPSHCYLPLLSLFYPFMESAVTPLFRFCYGESLDDYVSARNKDSSSFTLIVMLSQPTPSCTIRSAREDDISAVNELAYITFPMACPDSVGPEDIIEHCASQFSTERLLNHLCNIAHYLVVSEDQNSHQLLGYMLLVAGAEMDPTAYENLQEKPSLGVDKLYVRKEFHGCGIATALMEHAVEQAFACGYSSLWLATNSYNKRALRFYEKQGFTPVGTRIYYVGKTRNDDVVLEKPLISSLSK